MKQYIVLAHLPTDPDDPAFHGDLRFHPTEWCIFTGRTAYESARRKARMYAQYFREVQVREVGEYLSLSMAPQDARVGA